MIDQTSPFAPAPGSHGYAIINRPGVVIVEYDEQCPVARELALRHALQATESAVVTVPRRACDLAGERVLHAADLAFRARAQPGDEVGPDGLLMSISPPSQARPTQTGQ